MKVRVEWDGGWFEEEVPAPDTWSEWDELDDAIAAADVEVSSLRRRLYEALARRAALNAARDSLARAEAPS